MPCCKCPSDSLLCSSDIDELSIGEQLKVMRLRSGLTINEAARLAGIDRCTLMNYEQGRTTRVKRRTVERLIEIYHKH
ncbi:MAG: helix-turn-helix domain-containing protein [Oscillospiraceae bacterium]|nr:helix-turn-helix domain-containing protein [Oscillospiraceae bacterium]